MILVSSPRIFSLQPNTLIKAKTTATTIAKATNAIRDHINSGTTDSLESINLYFCDRNSLGMVSPGSILLSQKFGLSNLNFNKAERFSKTILTVAGTSKQRMDIE